MYSVQDYGSMLDDRNRMRAYEAALRQSITPGCSVLDIGTGIGVMAILACQYGASRVVAIEPNDAILVARQLAADNGYADRIEFIKGLSTDVTFTERFDVIVSDLRGVTPLYGHHIHALNDARARHLAPGGVLIPQRDWIRAAVVESAEAYAFHAAPWGELAGLDSRAYSTVVTNEWRRTGFTAAHLLTSTQLWCELDYRSDLESNVAGSLSFSVDRGGTAHGIGVWFDAELTEGVEFSNAPDRPEMVYGRAFFPLGAPVVVAEGDSIDVDLRAHLVDDDYIWVWNTRITRGGEHELVARFNQSSSRSRPIDLQALKKAADTHVPHLGRDGEIAQFVLAGMTGDRTVRDLALAVQERFPDRFRSEKEALKRVAELSRTFST